MDEFSGAAINWAQVRPVVGISACLLGERVRHDGGHKRGEGWVDELGAFVTWLGMCPEVDLGLGTPREPIQIERAAGTERLRGVHSRADLTHSMSEFVRARVKALRDSAGLCGFVAKSRSPSCAVSSAPVIEPAAPASKLTSGLFVRELQLQLPDLPVVEETALTTEAGRDHFLAEIRSRYRNLAGMGR